MNAQYIILARVYNKGREESVEHAYRHGMNSSERHVTSAHLHVLHAFNAGWIEIRLLTKRMST